MDTTYNKRLEDLELDFLNDFIHVEDDNLNKKWDDEESEHFLGVRLTKTTKDLSETVEDYTLRHVFCIDEGNYISFMLHSTMDKEVVMDRWNLKHEIAVEVNDELHTLNGRFTCKPLAGGLYLVTGRIKWSDFAGLVLQDIGFHIYLGDIQIFFTSKNIYNIIALNLAEKLQPLDLYLTTSSVYDESCTRHGFGPDERDFAYVWFVMRNNFPEEATDAMLVEAEFEVRNMNGVLKTRAVASAFLKENQELVAKNHFNMEGWEDGFYRVDVKVYGQNICHAIFGIGKRLNGKPMMTLSGRKKEKRTQRPSGIKAIECIHKMIGLEEVKKHLEQNICYVRMMEARKQAGLPCVNRLMHVVMTGSPGTGKTTVARLLGAAYKEMNILSSGHTVECNRATLVQDHIGGTEKATLDKIEEARGGVLFIDEAYSLFTKRESSNDFGLRIIDTLMTVLSDPESNILVVLAGYADEMDKLLMSNPGLASRFPVRLHFPDYTVDELMLMTESWLTEHRYKANAQVMERIREVIAHAIKEKSFGSGRFVHTFIENTILPNMATRLFAQVAMDKYDSKVLSRILPQDIPVPEEVLSRIKGPEKKLRSIGFR